MRKKVDKSNMNLMVDYNFLIVCNNYIVSILKKADELKWSSEKINFKEKDKKKAKSGKYDMYYFRDHGYANVINKSLYKHIIFSLISDYSIYMYDALECAKRSHYGTAFTLLRKPLKDDLLLIEMFYTKGYRMVHKFLNEPIDNIAIDKISREEKIKIMRKCCKKINFFTANRMFNLRYSKKSKESLEKIWNKTAHIITSSKYYKTENGNLNIIFDTPDIVEENIIYFYKVCTSIQLYFLTLVFNILKDENLITEREFEFNIRQIYFAYSCTLEHKLQEECLNQLVLECNKCGKEIEITQKILRSNYSNSIFMYKCSCCNNINSIEEFQFIGV